MSVPSYKSTFQSNFCFILSKMFLNKKNFFCNQNDYQDFLFCMISCYQNKCKLKIFFPRCYVYLQPFEWWEILNIFKYMI